MSEGLLSNCPCFDDDIYALSFLLEKVGSRFWNWKLVSMIFLELLTFSSEVNCGGFFRFEVELGEMLEVPAAVSRGI